MARPRSITWDKRVAIFLTYRLVGRKIHPVAIRYGVSRSTVRVIVKEFLDMGFSEMPRAKVSENLLEQMQEQHLAGLVELPRRGVGRLNLGPGTSSEAGRQDAMAHPLTTRDESRWHLKGTRAEQVIEEATNANRDYLQRESEEWQVLRVALECVCHLPERDGGIGEDPDPHLLPALGRQLRDAFFAPAFRAEPPPPTWLTWDTNPDAPEILRLASEPVGIGSPEDHQRIKEGLTLFLATAFQEHQRRFIEVERLRLDMGLIDGILNEELQAITGDDIRRGICPSCPYPEATLEPITGAKR